MCSENNGADQLRSYCQADLRLCFRQVKISGFLKTPLIYLHANLLDNVTYIPEV